MSTSTRRRYEGRDTGPVQQLGEVVDRRRLGQYWGLTVTAGEIAHRAKPGQFVNVEVRAPGTLLRRPFSVAGASPSGPVAGTIEFVVDAHGPGTDVLGRQRTGDRLALLGPLGRPFPVPKRRVSAVLVGGGYGAAPLYWLGGRLRAAGHKLGFVIGAADQHRVLEPIVAKRMATHSQFTTEDGSLGAQGRVTDVLSDALVATAAEVVYACGPNAMLAAVSEMCAARDIPCQVAVEEHMACGVGVCMTCVLPIHARDGGVERRRVCVDGPVFTSTRVAWEESRYVDAAPPDNLDDDAAVEVATAAPSGPSRPDQPATVAPAAEVPTATRTTDRDRRDEDPEAPTDGAGSDDPGPGDWL